MKKVVISLSLCLFCSVLSAKEISLKSADIIQTKTETVNGLTKYFVITKTAKIQLVNFAQMKAVQSLIYKKDTITINVN